jgi:hypothetical protein
VGRTVEVPWAYRVESTPVLPVMPSLYETPVQSVVRKRCQDFAVDIGL